MTDRVSRDSTLIQCIEASDIICGRLEKHEDEMRAAVCDGIQILMQLRDASRNPTNSIHSSLESCSNESLEKLGSLHLCSIPRNSPFTPSIPDDELLLALNKQSFSSAVRGLLMPSSVSNDVHSSFSDMEPPSRISSAGMSVDSEQIASETPERKEDSSSEEVKEEVYCTCRQGSEGDMIACDYENCLTKWFHMKCVNLSRIPGGNWYCRDCRSSKSNRLRKDLL